MRYTLTTFGFPVELGARLRELREQTGLSLEELAHRMGRRPGYHYHLGRLNSRPPGPSSCRCQNAEGNRRDCHVAALHASAALTSVRRAQ